MPTRGKYGQGRVYQPTYKAADGTRKTVQKWYIQYYDQNGKQRREPTDAKTEREARTTLNSRLHQVDEGTVPTGSRNLTYGDLRKTILTHYKTNKMRSLETMASGEHTLKGMAKLDEFFGWSAKSNGIKVRDINNVLWSKFIEQRRSEGVSDATIRNSGGCLRQMFSVAASPEYKLLNPAQVPTLTMPKPPKPRKDFATKEEFDKILKVLPVKFHPYITWLFYQATRKKEAQNVIWSQVDLVNAMYFPDPDRNKTADDTPRPLADEVVRQLNVLPQLGPDEPVFSIHTAKGFKKAFRRACLKTGLGKITWQCSQCGTVYDQPAPETKDAPGIVCDSCKKRSKGSKLIPCQWHYVGLTIHGLRRSAVVYYREAGFGDSEIMSITGHKSTETFLGYSATRVEQMRKRLSSAAAERERLQHQQKRLTA
jgi:integrase